jgi:hypothetical protein
MTSASASKLASSSEEAGSSPGFTEEDGVMSVWATIRSSLGSFDKVFVTISTDDVQYKHQRSRWKGLRGTVQRPVCAVVQRPEGLSLEFYSCRDEEATITRAVYIPKAAIDENNGVDVSEKCYEAVTYAVAWLVLTTTGEAERAEVMNAKALNLLGIEKQ